VDVNVNVDVDINVDGCVVDFVTGLIENGAVESANPFDELFSTGPQDDAMIEKVNSAGKMNGF